MKRVYRYPLPGWPTPQEVFCLDLPEESTILSVGYSNRHEQPSIWALIDSTKSIESRTFKLAGTGRTDLAENDIYLGTIQNGRYLVHIFESVPLHTGAYGGIVREIPTDTTELANRIDEVIRHYVEVPLCADCGKQRRIDNSEQAKGFVQLLCTCQRLEGI